jgi:AraC-like DNA-binding protein
MTRATKSLTGSQVLDDVAEVIGAQAALDLAFEFRLPALRAQRPRSRAAHCSRDRGRSGAKLCDHYYRTIMYMPISEALRLKAHALCAQGITKREIAEALHITERRVYRLLKALLLRCAARGRHDRKTPAKSACSKV